MARGRGGRGGRSHGSHHHHHRGGYGGGGKGPVNVGGMLQTTMDSMSSGLMPPTLVGGIYSFQGNQMSFSAQIDSLSVASELTAGHPYGSAIQQANIVLVGSKTKAGNSICFCITMVFGALLIFPLILMCFDWWRKITFPMYQLSLEAYRNLATFIRSCPSLNSLQLQVADSAFNQQKARILYEILSSSRITTFSFTNRMLCVNYQSNQADGFRDSMLPIKSLNITSSIIWGDIIM